MPLESSKISVGDRRTTVIVENLTRTQIVQYAGASGDFNPIHHDEVYATRSAGYPTIFAHGMLTMGATASAVTGWVGAGRLTKFGVRFTRQVWPGDTLTCTVTVAAIGDDTADFEVVTSNQDDAVVVSGYATARIDS